MFLKSLTIVFPSLIEAQIDPNRIPAKTLKYILRIKSNGAVELSTGARLLAV